MAKITRPPSKAGLFLKAANIKGSEASLKIKAVRPDQDLPAGKTTILDFDIDGKTYGFPLNRTNNRTMSELFGRNKTDIELESWDGDDAVGKMITFYKVVVNNPQTGREGESLRIRGPKK
jgi:hypothetical protein